LCREEALELSSLKEDLDSRHVRLSAVVHETPGVEAFQPYFKGDVYFDEKKHFFGPTERWMPVLGIFRLNSIINIIRSIRKGVDGDLKGEGRLLGGVYVIGPGDQGVIFQHFEMEFGDIVNKTQILEAVNKMKKTH